MTAYDIIIRPLISEKSMQGIETRIKKYVFVVAKNATKTQIKMAIEEIFDGTKVAKVNIVNARGKLKRQGRTQGYTSDFKKAYVTLAPQSKPIAFFDALS